MATTGLLSAHHLLHTSEHHRSHSRPCASSVYDHVLHAAPHCQRQQHRAALLVHSSTCFEAAAAHQQQLPGQSCSNHLACGGLNGGHPFHQQAQQHRGSNTCEAVSGDGNWSIAAGPSLGWNTASTFFNKYRLGEVMGSGTFGEVRTAVHLQTGKPRYAVKVLSKHRIEVDAIRREVQTWQQAQNSKYVAKLEGLFEDEDKVYIVQELCTGGTLCDHLNAKGPCSEHEAANIMQGVLDLLVECHRRQICYGDLKPANIMFSGNAPQQQQHQRPQVRAIDFGSSKTAHGQALTQTVGTPLYIAPEVILQRYGVGADVWSAGILLYQMLTGRMPFWPKKTLEEVAKLPRYEIVAAVGNYEVQFPRSLWADISPDAKELVEHMLDRNPATRITAAEALQHPWLCATLGYTPTPSSDTAIGANNVVEFRSPLRPKPVALSPGKGSLVPGPLIPQKSGPLSPQKSSPLRSMLSGELPASLLMADLQRQPMPAFVPAAE